MKIIIDNQLHLFGIPPDLRQYFVENLTFRNPKYDEAVDNGRSTRGIPKTLELYKPGPNGISIPRGYLQIVEECLIGQGLNIEIQDNRIIRPPVEVNSQIRLRPYQAKAKFDLLVHPNGILVAPAASGKTVMGLDLFATLKQKTLWLTHTNRLANQVIDRLLSMFGDIDKTEVGFIGGGKWRVGERFTVGMIPTLVRRETELLELGREFGLVIVDETHHVPASTFLVVLGYFSSYYLYGLTATPYRRDRLEGMMFATMGLPNSVVERDNLTEVGGIITPKVIKRSVPSQVYDGNDYSTIIRDLLLPNPLRLKMIVQDILNEAQAGNYCIVISIRKIYCEQIHHELERVIGDRALIATGDYTKKHNEEQVSIIDRGEANVLVTTFELLGEGFDVRRLNRGFIVLPFRERSRVEQSVGRIQRTAEDKNDAILYDYVDENIGILSNQFLHRSMAYRSLGMKIEQR